MDVVCQAEGCTSTDVRLVRVSIWGDPYDPYSERSKLRFLYCEEHFWEKAWSSREPLTGFYRYYFTQKWAYGQYVFGTGWVDGGSGAPFLG